jgi:hypothetical protein
VPAGVAHRLLRKDSSIERGEADGVLAPLLTDDHMTGAQPVERQLRPPTVATAVDRTDFSEAVRTVHELYDSWGGAFMPLVVAER